MREVDGVFARGRDDLLCRSHRRRRCGSDLRGKLWHAQLLLKLKVIGLQRAEGGREVGREHALPKRDEERRGMFRAPGKSR